MKAIVYARFSSQEQANSTTLETQISQCRDYADQQGWEISDVVTDEGMSAYTGENIRTGNLAKLINQCRLGDYVARDTVIVVRKLDRLSRADSGIMFSWFLDALRMGLSIATVKDNRTYSWPMDMGEMFLVIAEAFQNNLESQKKSDHSSDYWELSRRKGEINPNLNHPAWLEVKDGELVARPDAVAVIEQIFELAEAGLGTTRIASRLNEDRVVPFSHSNREAAKHWNATRVSRIIYNDALIGFYTPHTRPRKGAMKRAGPKIRRYPVVIDPSRFEAVNSKSVKKKKGGRGIKNLFPRLTRCHHCDGPMFMKGDAARGYHYLFCKTSKNGSGDCDKTQSWRYADVEGPILDLLLSRSLDDSYFAKDVESAGPLVQELSEIRAKVVEKSDQFKWLLQQQTKFELDEVESVTSAVAKELKALKARVVELEEQIDELRGRVSPEEHIERVRSLRSDLEHEDEIVRTRAKVTVREAIADLVEWIEFDADYDNVIVHLAGGVGTYIILYGDGSLVTHSTDLERYKDHPRYKTIERFIRSA